MRAWITVAALAAMLGLTVATLAQRHAESRRTPARTVTLEVGGMVCPVCSLKVRTALAGARGVRSVDLSLARQRALVTCDPGTADSTLTQAVRRAGPEYLGLVVGK